MVAMQAIMALEAVVGQVVLVAVMAMVERALMASSLVPTPPAAATPFQWLK
jgi:hypothetical protein